MPAKALLVGKSCDADDHRVAILAVREEGQSRRLAAYLVLGIVQIGQKLDFRDRHKAIMPHPDGEAQYGLFVEQCIKDPRRAEFLLQPLGHPVHPALARHIFAK